MLSSLLPKPKHSAYLQPVLVATTNISESSGGRLSWIEQTDKDSEKNNNSSRELNLYKLNQKVISATEVTTRKVQATYEESIPLKKRHPNLKHHFPRYTWETCPDDSVQNCVSATKQVIDKLLGYNRDDSKKDQEVSIKYSTGDDQEERTIQIRTLQEDPMLPPKFKLRKNRHREPSPPPPILKDTSSATQKLTKEDREKWKIPAAVSNWKNNQGFALSLEDRISAATAGEEHSQDGLNVEKFSALSNALENADKEARVEISMRNKMRQEQALREQKEKEEKLRELAVLARNDKYRRHEHGSGGKRARRQ